MLRIAVRAPRGFASVIMTSNKTLQNPMKNLDMIYVKKNILYRGYGIGNTAKLPHIAELSYNTITELDSFNPEIAIIHDTRPDNFPKYNKGNHLTIKVGKIRSADSYSHFVSFNSIISVNPHKRISRNNIIRMELRDDLFTHDEDMREEQWEIACELIKKYIFHFNPYAV